MTGIVPSTVLGLAILGCIYLGLAVAVVLRYVRTCARPAAPLATQSPTLSFLKPLAGAHAGLAESLRSAAEQQIDAPIEIVCGVADLDDPAIPVVSAVRRDHPHLRIALRIDDTRHGSNAKVSNLVNLSTQARFRLLVVTDSDIVLPQGYAVRVVAAVREPGVGAATCPYAGIAGPGHWSRLAALGINGHFLPNVLTGVALGLATPCLGSTIAIEADTLARIGGFRAFADVLADDYAIGSAVRARGLCVAVAPVLVGHVCAEPSLGALWRHDVRWARTIRLLDPVGHAASIVTHPLPLALLAGALGGGAPALAVAALAVALRVALCSAVAAGHPQARVQPWLVPLRDLLSFAVYVWSHAGRRVAWHGRTFDVHTDGSLLPRTTARS